MTTANLNATTHLRLRDMGVWSGPTDRTNSYTIRFVLRGLPSSGTSSPIFTHPSVPAGLYIENDGGIKVTGLAGGSHTISGWITPSTVINVEHQITVKWRRVDGTNTTALFVEYFGARITQSMIANSDITDAFVYIGRDSAGVHVPIEVRELHLDGSYACGWIADVQKPNLLTNPIYNLRSSDDTSIYWTSDYGATTQLEIVNVSSQPTDKWWREYDPAPVSGAQSLLIGTNRNECVKFAPNQSVYTTNPLQTNYVVEFSFWNFFGNTLEGLDKIGILTDSSGLNGFFIDNDCTIGIYRDGIRVISSTLTWLSTNGLARRGMHEVKILVSPFDRTVTFGSGPLLPDQEVIPIPGGVDDFIFPPNVFFDTVGGQSWNIRSYMVKLWKFQIGPALIGSSVGNMYETVKIHSAEYSPTANGFINNGTLSAKLSGYTGEFSPWVYEGSEYPIRSVYNEPIKIVKAGISPIVIPKSTYAHYFQLDMETHDEASVQVDFVLHSGNSEIQLVGDDIVFTPTKYYTSERLLVQAIMPYANDESAYTFIDFSILPANGFSNDFEPTAFGVQVSAEETSIVRVPAFNANAFNIGAFEGIYDAPPATPSGIQRWDGSAWTQVPLFRWNGSTWDTVYVQQWNGSTWVGGI